METLNGMPVLSGERDYGFRVVVDVEHGDLVVPNSLCAHKADASWFGGPLDREDDGNTASGVEDHAFGVMGCSLPLDGTVRSTAGSPIPHLPWRDEDGKRIMVRVYCHATGKQITVPLIDIGPSFGTGHAIDLTEAAFEALGLSLSQGLAGVDFRILCGARYLGAEARAALRGAGYKLPDVMK